MLKNEKLYKISSKKTNSKWDSREAINILGSWLYYQVSTSSRKGYNPWSI